MNIRDQRKEIDKIIIGPEMSAALYVKGLKIDNSVFVYTVAPDATEADLLLADVALRSSVNTTFGLLPAPTMQELTEGAYRLIEDACAADPFSKRILKAFLLGQVSACLGMPANLSDGRILKSNILLVVIELVETVREYRIHKDKVDNGGISNG